MRFKGSLAKIQKTYTMKKTIITALLALVALAGEAKVSENTIDGTLPADWFTTDSVVVRGHIEDYDAEQLGFSDMECYLYDVTTNDNSTLSMSINPDGSFEKRFVLSYPMKMSFHASSEPKTDFYEFQFFVRPGEVVDVTIRKNSQGKYECFYNGGSSKEVERWLKADLQLSELTKDLARCKGTFAEVNQLADATWQKLMDSFQTVSQREHFTPWERQLAMAEVQHTFALAYMDNAFHREMGLMKQEFRDGIYYTEITDSVEWDALHDYRNYTALRYIDFNNPLLMVNEMFYFTINRIQFSKYVNTTKYKAVIDEGDAYYATMKTEETIIANNIDALCTMLATDKDNLFIQLCVYKDLMNGFDNWRLEEEDALADSTMTETEWQETRTPGKVTPLYLAILTHPYLHQKAEQFYATKMAQTDYATPLPDSPATDLIRRISAKYPGRYLMIDFWGMGCGPCRSAIQQSKGKRAEIAKRDDVKLIFIAEERTTEGSDAYHKYVSEWLADEETICLDRVGFHHMQELFRFTGIPYYETITPDCRRVRDDLRINGFYNFNHELERLKEKLK